MNFLLEAVKRLGLFFTPTRLFRLSEGKDPPRDAWATVATNPPFNAADDDEDFDDIDLDDTDEWALVSVGLFGYDYADDDDDDPEEDE